VLIDYYLNNDRLRAFVLYQGNLRLLEKEVRGDLLANKTSDYMGLINNTIDVYNNYNNKTISNHFNRTRELSFELFKIIMGWDELIEIFKFVDLIYIVPDDILYGIPFATLAINSDMPPKFLIEEGAIIYLPSSSFLNSMSKKVAYKNNSILIAGNNSLNGVNKAISHIQKSFRNSTTYMPTSQQTVNKIVDEITRNYNGFIFIGHGRADDKYPDHSNIEIVGFNDSTKQLESVNVYMKNLVQASKNELDFAILIGCETASGKIYQSTGLSGIQQGFLMIGTKNVIGTLWKIELAQTLAQLRDFIDAVANEDDFAFAIRHFQLQTIKRLYNDNYIKFPHPYFWGGYTLFSIQNQQRRL
jgi:CHAT domain-containing protein